jgi:hypothetical protein
MGSWGEVDSHLTPTHAEGGPTAGASGLWSRKTDERYDNRTLVDNPAAVSRACLLACWGALFHIGRQKGVTTN